MSSPAPWILGLDLGGTRIKALFLTPDGIEIARVTAPSGGDDWKESVKQCVDQLLETHGAPAAIGVAAPGLPAKDGRSIAHMPGRLQGLVDLDWQAFLGFHKSVPVLNDAHAALLGEVWLGAARSLNDDLLLPLADEMARVEWRPLGQGVPILRAALGEWAGAIGAASNVR